MILSEGDAVYAANKFIDYYTQFNRIDDYLRFVKKDRIKGRVGSIFGADTEFFDAFDMHPNDMNFEIKVVDTDPKTSSRDNQWLYSETLNLTASNPIEEAIPGRTHKWIVVETSTDKVVGVVRFGSPTINSKPRNDYFGKVLPLSDINAHFVMGFNIVPTQPFGTDLKYFETTSLYGTTKGVSMYDGLKPFLRHIGDTESNFLPLFHDDEFRDFFWWFNDRNGGERLVPADKSSKKLKIQQKMIAIIRKSLKDEDKLNQFNDCIDHAKSLTEKKRYYFGKFEHTTEEVITWWKKKATKRYEKLQAQERVRTQLEIWKPGIDLEIIR